MFVFRDIDMAVSHLLLHLNWTPVRRNKNIPKIYPRYIQDIQDKYKIPSGRRPGPVFRIYLGNPGDILDMLGIIFGILLIFPDLAFQSQFVALREITFLMTS